MKKKLKLPTPNQKTTDLNRSDKVWNFLKPCIMLKKSEIRQKLKILIPAFINWTAPCINIFRHMRTAKAQISLLICAGWCGFLLSAYWIIGYCRIYRCKTSVLIRLHGFAGWSGSLLFPYALKTFFLGVAQLIFIILLFRAMWIYVLQIIESSWLAPNMSRLIWGNKAWHFMWISGSG